MSLDRCFLTAVALGVLVGPSSTGSAGELPDWTSGIRDDHPRLFFNAGTWDSVRARALGPEKAWYEHNRRRVERLLPEADSTEPLDLGPDAARAAFVFRMTDDQQYLTLAQSLLERSIAYYEKCYEERRAVNWYSTSRVHATMAWDWLHDDLPGEKRRVLLSRLVQVMQNVFTARPRIYRENLSGPTTGYYGATNCKWFLGCTGYGTGIEDALVNKWLVEGYEDFQALLAHRRRACGDDGGSASPTLGYAFGAYPWSEQNFFYTWLSATGENIAPDWPHGAWLANYVIWNWIETGNAPGEFGYGDTPHTHNRLPISQLYTHMANIRHLYGREAPQAAALARHIQGRLPERNRSYSSAWFIYPFLLTRLEESPPPLAPERLPKARHFENMGQIFLRSGTDRNATCCLFTCGGILDQHRHFDALNFVIYHRGYLALDSGTRYREFDNGEHLANYFAQTVAHNCVVVHQPGEPPARYWGGTVEGCHGGQHRQLGSEVRAFESHDRFVYVAGDATRCYFHGSDDLPEKVSLVTRQLVFLLPDRFIVFDRVTSTDAAYRKDWLLHTAHEPEVRGKLVRADHEEGRLFSITLLPEDARLASVGGPGREFLAAGKNWEIDRGDLGPESLALMGQWRVEVTPGTSRKDDVFLHVLQVGARTLEEPGPAELVRREGEVGVRVEASSGTCEVTFRTQGELGGHILIEGAEGGIDRPLATTVEAQQGILARPE